MRSLTEADIKALTGTRSFERGLGYLDAVSGIEVGDGWVTAFVHGTERYEVELSLDRADGPAGECDCPYGPEGNFRKHLVFPRPDRTGPAREPAATAEGGPGA